LLVAHSLIVLCVDYVQNNKSADGGDLSLRVGAAAYDCASPTPSIPLWSFVTPPSDGQFTETPSAIAVSEGGEVVAVTSWGDAKQLNAQVRVARRMRLGVPRRFHCFARNFRVLSRNDFRHARILRAHAIH
jgi:hypothetical protein